jgi:transcriptional regulator with XRE-family HTH domain
MASPQEKALMVAFGKRLQELRRQRHMTQEQLAATIDVDVTTIAFIEGGTRFVRLATLRKLALALDVELMELFKGVRVR